MTSSLFSEKLVYYMVVHFEGPFGNFRALTKMVRSGWKIIFPLAEMLGFHLLNSAISPVLLRAKDLYRLKLLCKHIMSAMKNTPPPSHCTGGFVNLERTYLSPCRTLSECFCQPTWKIPCRTSLGRVLSIPRSFTFQNNSRGEE